MVNVRVSQASPLKHGEAIAVPAKKPGAPGLAFETWEIKPFAQPKADNRCGNIPEVL